MSENNDFALSAEYQNHVLNLMLRNTKFCDLAALHLKPEYFSNKAQQWFYNALTGIDVAHLTPVTLQEELVKAAKKGAIKEAELPEYLKLYQNVSGPLLPDDQTHIQENFSRFIRTQAVKRAIMESAQLIQTGAWDEIEQKISLAVSTGTDITNLGQNYFDDFADRLNRRLHEQSSVRLPIGIPEIDTEFLNGGLGNKQLGLIVGATGRGKSVFLSHIAKTAVLLGKKVVYYTLELDEDVIGMRFDSTFTQIRPQELKQKYEESFEKLSKLTQKYANSLWIKEYPAKKASVNTLIAHYKMLCDNGFVPDVVIVDYLDLLSSERQYSELRFELDYITQRLRGFAQEYDTRVWTATQTSRAGYNAETPDGTHISEAFSKMFTVDVCLIMAQTADEQEDEILRIRVEKNRNGKVGRVVEITTDYGFMTFYRNTIKKEETQHGTSNSAPLHSLPEDVGGTDAHVSSIEGWTDHL